MNTNNVSDKCGGGAGTVESPDAEAMPVLVLLHTLRPYGKQYRRNIGGLTRMREWTFGLPAPKARVPLCEQN